MSKYNHIKSIPIEELSKEELNQAIKEWAEGDEAMERLLWSCYNNGLKTNGCHAGKIPYIGIEYEENSKNKISKLINTVINEKGSRIMLSPDGGNPLSGPSWYKPDIVLGSNAETEIEAKQLFDKMSNDLNNNESNNNYSSVVNLLDFLVGKYSGLLLRLGKNQNDDYVFTIEKNIHEEEMGIYNELNNLLTSSGLIRIDNNISHKNWALKSTNQEEFIDSLNKISENIINNYAIKKSESVEETSSFKIKAHLKRDEFIKQGREKDFDLWLMGEESRIKEKMDKSYQERKEKENKQKENNHE